MTSSRACFLRRAFLVVLVAAASAAVAIFAWRTRDREPVVPASTARSAGGSSTELDVESVQPSRGGAPLAVTARGTESENDPATSLDARVTKSGAASVVLGRVVIPPGTPADEHVRILVRFAERDGDGTWLELDRDGRFVLEFAPGEEDAELGLFARYLFLTERVTCTNASSELVLEPELGARVEGRVRVPPGYEWLFETFRVDLGAHSPVGTATQWRENCESPRTATDGSFVIDGVVAGWAQRVLVDAPAARRTASEIFTPRPGETLRFEWDWRVGATLAGRVVDDTGAGIERAVVRADGWDPSAVTDADGRFELTSLPPRSCKLAITAPGFVPRVETLDALGEAQRREGATFVLSRGFTVRLVVRYPDGSPAREPAFELAPGELSALLQRAFAFGLTIAREPDGVLVITGLPALTFAGTVRALPPDGQDAAPPWLAHARVDPERDAELRVVLEPSERSLRGRVVRAAGEPAPMAVVQASALDAEVGEDSFDETLTTRATPPLGEFGLDLPRAGRWLVHASDGTTQSSSVVVDSLTIREPLELRLASRGRIVGRVVGPDGITGIRATIGGIAEAHRSLTDGSFDVPATPGRVELFATRAGFAPSEVVVLDLAPAATVSGVELVLRRGGSVVGRVASAAWRSLDDVRVMAWSLSASGPTDSREVTLDAEGRFGFDALLPGPWAFELRGAGDSDRPSGGTAAFRPFARLVVRDGERHELELAADGVHVVGRLTRGGRPVGGRWLGVYAQDDGSGDALDLESDAQGAFEFIAPEPGEYVVETERDDESGSSFCTVRVPRTARHEFEFELGDARIVGRLVPADGSIVLAGTLVQVLHGEHGDVARTEADADGRFEFLGLREGRYRVFVGVVEFDDGWVTSDGSRVGRAVADAVAVDGETVTELTIPVRKAATVFGRAWSTTQLAPVGLRIVDATTGGELSRRRTLAPAGGFRCSGLPFGRLRLEWRDPATDELLVAREIDVDTTPFGPVELRIE